MTKKDTKRETEIRRKAHAAMKTELEQTADRLEEVLAKLRAKLAEAEDRTLRLVKR